MSNDLGPLGPTGGAIGSGRLDAMVSLPHSGLRAERAGQTKLQAAAEQFEAVMLKEVVKSMRATTTMDGSEPKCGVMLDEMMDDALAGHLAKSGGIGLAQYLETIGNEASLKEDSRPPVSVIRSIYASRGR